MQIIGESGKVNVINIQHNSTSFIYAYQVPSALKNIFSDGIPHPQTATIIFEDLSEVDELIKMLTQFKEKQNDYFGNWAVKHTYIGG